MTSMPQRIRNEIRTAYADAGPQRDEGAFTNDMRCLSFCASGWLTPEHAAEAVSYIGSYNCFEPETVAEMLAEVAQVDPDALVTIGRESSPVLYVETADADAVMSVFDQAWHTDADSPWGRGSPDELGTVQADAVPSYRQDFYEDRDIHLVCSHDSPPVEDGDWATAQPSNEYVRAWWD